MKKKAKKIRSSASSRAHVKDGKGNKGDAQATSRVTYDDTNLGDSLVTILGHAAGLHGEGGWRDGRLS